MCGIEKRETFSNAVCMESHSTRFACLSAMSSRPNGSWPPAAFQWWGDIGLSSASNGPEPAASPEQRRGVERPSFTQKSKGASHRPSPGYRTRSQTRHSLRLHSPPAFRWSLHWLFHRFRNPFPRPPKRHRLPHHKTRPTRFSPLDRNPPRLFRRPSAGGANQEMVAWKET
jgi:hypothetical protein